MNIKVYKLSNGGGDYSTAAKTSDCEEVELFVSPQENLKTCFWCGSINSNVNIFFFQSVAGVEFTHISLPGWSKSWRVLRAAAEPECSEKCCFVGKKIFNLHFFKKISDHWRSVISLISPLHPSAGLHSCSLSSSKGKKHHFRAILFCFPLPPPGCIRKSGIKSLSSPPWLLYCQSERSDRRDARWKTGAAAF